MKERRWKDMQDQLDREREEAFLRAQREAERKRRERELLHIQEEQERLQRKKRIEEIMKRTRKNEADTSSSAQAARGQVEREQEEEEVGVEVQPISAASGPLGGAVPDPVISLGPLETKICGDELSDGVQSMDVSPVSRDELDEPISEGVKSLSVSNALEQLLDLAAGSAPFPRVPPGSAAVASVTLGDLNKNLLIQGCCSASFAAGPAPDSASQLIRSLASSPGALDIQ